jgi:hypothetical protein
MRGMVSSLVNLESRKYPSEIDESFHPDTVVPPHGAGGASESTKMGNLIDYSPDL